MAGLSGTACCNPVRSPLTRSCPSAVLILRNPLCSFSADLCYPPLSVGAGRINNLVCSAMNKRAGGHIIHAMGAEASPTMPHAAKTSASEGDGKAPPSISEYRNDIRSISLSLSITDALPSRACLGNAMYHQSARKGEEMPGLETQISYSHETVMAFKPELSLRLSRLHSISKNRSSRSRMNPMAVSHEMHKNGRDLAGTASLGFGRKKDGVTLTRGKSDPLLHKYGERQLKQDADDMFDKTPQRICSPNRGSLSVSAQTECDKKEYGSQQKPEMSKPFQILIAHLSGKSILQWVRATDLVQELKLLMEKRTGIPSMYQRLLYEAVLKIWRNADAVCFDVDSTVCKDEGIDELAEFCGAGEAVAAWTSRAMGGSVPFEEALTARLSLFRPSISDVANYLESNPPRLNTGIQDLVKNLKAKGVDVFLVSGGFRQMIEPVADLLGIPYKNIFANRLLFDSVGEFQGFDPEEPTSRSGGKATAVAQIKKEHGYKTLVMVGDGATDLEARRPGGADAYICYGGIQLRDKVAEAADWLVLSFDDLIKELG